MGSTPIGSRQWGGEVVDVVDVVDVVEEAEEFSGEGSKASPLERLVRLALSAVAARGGCCFGFAFRRFDFDLRRPFMFLGVVGEKGESKKGGLFVQSGFRSCFPNNPHCCAFGQV